MEEGSSTPLVTKYAELKIKNFCDICLCGAGVAHSLGKGEATGSNPVKGKFEFVDQSLKI